MDVPQSGAKTIAAAAVCLFTVISVGGTQRQAGTSSKTNAKASVGSNAPATARKVASLNADITTYLTHQIVTPGSRFSAVVEIEPHPGIHVYAPEVEGYRPLKLAIQSRPGLLIRSAHYPRSELYFFPALEENVPVYQLPFRIVQDLMMDRSSKGQAAFKEQSDVRIIGVLEYQACDDKICFRPQSVPLSWDVKFRPLDR